MASPYAFQQAVAPPPTSRRGISPATSIFSRARSRTPPAALALSSNRYNPALYSATTSAVGPGSLRRPSPSPMRTRGEDGGAGRQYNPQTFGQLSGNGGAFVPRQNEEVPPPPYSPPHSARGPGPLSAHSNGPLSARSNGPLSPPHNGPLSARSNGPLSPPHSARGSALQVSPPQRQTTWTQNQTPTSPNNNVSQQPTPSTASSLQSFNGYPTGGSAAATTPLTPNVGPQNWQSPTRRRGYSPPTAQVQGPYTPSGLQQTSFPAEIPQHPIIPPNAHRNPSAPPQMRSSNATSVPPPPPGPPPAASRSASMSASMPPSAHREDSQTRGANGVPPPPPGPPPRSESLTRIQQLMQRQRTVSGPLSTRQGFVGSRQSPPVPEVPEILTLPSSSPPPAVPPKRKMEQQEDSGRQRASPRHEEERERQRREDNNPWKEAIDSPRRAATLPNQQSFSASPRAITPARVAPPQLSPPPHTLELIRERESIIIESFTEPEPSPTFTVYRDSNPALNGSAVRRKPVGPQLVTQDLGRGPQLPTPPPQQSSPISPGLNNRESNATLKANGEGPSRKDTGKEPEGPEDFIHQTRRRYKEMLQAEDAAYTDADKLRIFLHFVERECKIRQPLYSQADPTDLKRVVKILQVIAMEEHESLTPISPVGRQRADRDGDIDMSSPPDQKTRPGTQWWGQNLTAASFPTSAMSAYEQRVAEEESSRGRASSRWWENSNDDGGSCSVSELVRSDDNDSVYGSAYPRRSKRFTKKPRQSLKEIAELANSPRSLTSGPGISHDAASYLNSTVYPPDRKAGSRSRSRAPGSSRTRVPRRRDNLKTSLDIAPLLTLLPVWPREYPAINNCHPRLDVFRDLVRTLNDLTMLKDLQQRFAEKTGKTKDSFVTESQRRRISQAERIQRLYSRGDLHYDEMERLNLDFEREETKINHEAEEEDFKAFDVEVVTPAHRDLHERINAATAAYSDLIALIKARNPNLAADSEEQPELLEYLTALKWIFDVRETLHQSVFEMLTERNERYKSLTLGPLRTARDQSRFQSTSAFFTQDAATRLAEFNKQKILRHEQFMDFTENQVTLGVEEARSRFWEVAPLVMECLEKIPDNLENVVPIIPPEESSEHPEWVQQPMRYLERKIAETEGAMRGLGVEEGEGLLCLLHGVKSALTRARAEAVHGDDGRREERRLTEDLKEKVGMIEDEWREGLGGILERIKEDVEREMDRIEPGRKGS